MLSVLKWFLIGVSFFIISACVGGGGGENKTPDKNATIKHTEPVGKVIKGYVVDDPIQDANITIFSEDGKKILGSTKSNADGSFSITKPESNSLKFYILTVTNGTIKGKPFKGSMSRICLVDDIQSCNITPYTTLLAQLSGQFDGDIVSRLNKASNEVKTILNLDKDPFMTNSSSVDLSLWRNAIDNGLGLSDMIASLQSDLSDGYLDDESLKKIFIDARFRVEKTVTESDFTIDKTIKTPIEKDDNISLEHLSLPKDTIVKRELYSLNKGEKGSSVTSQGYLSDIAYVETQDYSKISGDANDTIERIIYQSFNVGKWRGKLNSETTILSKAFMAEPTLLFLPNSEKEKVANIIVKNPFFVQAKEEYRKIINYSLDANEELFNNLVMSLANVGKNSLNNNQINLSSKILNYKYKKLYINNSSLKLRKPSYKLVEKDKPYKVFDGMLIGYDEKTEGLKAYSRSSWWYGIQSLKNYENNEKWLSVSLVSPKFGFITKEDLNIIKSTPLYGSVESNIELDQIDADKLKSNESIDLVMFRNNPNTLLDAPQVMNIINVGKIVLKVAMGGLKFKVKTKSLKKVVNGMSNISEWKKKYEDDAKIFVSIFDLGTTIGELTCGDKDANCKRYWDNIEKLSAGIDSLYGGFDNSTSDNEEEIEKNFKKIVKNILVSLSPLRATKKKSKINLSKIKIATLKPLLLSELLIRPAAKIAENKELSEPLASYKFARQLFTDKKIQAKKKFRKLWIKAIKKGFKNKKLLYSINISKNFLKIIPKISKKIINFSSKDIAVKAIVETLAESANDIAADFVINALKNITPAKYFDLIMAANEGSAMLWDYYTDPSVVKFSLTKKDSKNINSEKMPKLIRKNQKIVWDIDKQKIPLLKAIRYLKVQKENKMVAHKTPKINGGSAKLYGNSWLYPLSPDPMGNHILVMSGFRTTIENQTAYKTEDDYIIKNLLKNNKISMMWHVKRFDNDIAEVKRTDRVASTAFKNAYINKPLDDTFWWFNDAIEDPDKNNPLQKAVLGNDIDSYKVIEFSKFYQNKTGKSNSYLLRHTTPGIYSDYSSIKFQADSSNMKLFENTLNVYVLPDFKTREKILQADAVIANSHSVLNRKYELQLNFKAENSWNLVDSLNMVLRYKLNGKIHYSKVIKIGKIDTDIVKAYSLPKNADVYNMQVIIFDDILKSYALHSGQGLFLTLKFAENYASRHNDSPIIILNTANMKRSEQLLLTPVDTDKDGVPDNFDAFPNNKDYQFDSDKDGMPDKWEETYGLNPYDAKDAIEDLNNNGISNLQEFKNGTNPKNHTPTANAGVDKTIKVGESVTLDASGSSDADGDTLTYEWKEADSDVILGTEKTLTLNNLSAGEHTFVLTVRDSNGAFDTDTVKVIVKAKSLPIAKITADTTTFTEGEQITLSASQSVDPKGKGLTYLWEHVSGGSLDNAILGNSETLTLDAKKLENIGTHVVRLTVTDINGDKNSTDITIILKGANSNSTLSNQVFQWEDESNSKYVSGHKYRHRYLLALYEDATCRLADLNLDIDKQNEDKKTKYTNTNKIYTPDEALYSPYNCNWNNSDTELNLSFNDGDKTIAIPLHNKTLKVGDVIDSNCIMQNGCKIIKKYPVANLDENNISSHSIEMFDTGGEIATWYFYNDNTIKIYTEGNTTAQFSGIWSVDNNYIDIQGTNGSTILRADKQPYKSGDWIDFTRIKGYISDIKPIKDLPKGKYKLKKTGQTKSYDENGNEVTDGSIKDDGYYKTGVTPSYTRDATKEIVTDNITKLQWQDDEDAKTVTKNWEEAKNYCQNLTLGGYSDWRLPTIVELQSIVVDGKFSPSIDTTAFVNYTTSSYYWSSITYASDTNNACYVNFYRGDTGNYPKSNNSYVRCVRAGQ